jgi:hypothetical protein
MLELQCFGFHLGHVDSHADRPSAGVENHSRLAHEDEAGSGLILPSFRALLEKCETIGSGASDVVHSLW